MANDPRKRPTLSPAVRRMVAEHELEATDVRATGRHGRITKGDVIRHLEDTRPVAVEAPDQPPAEPAAAVAPAPLEWEPQPTTPSTRESREPMSTFRHRVVESLLQVQQSAVILSSFGEVDMAPVLAWSERHPGLLADQPGTPGVLAFFVKAAASALEAVPEVNRHIEGDEIVQHHYSDVGLTLDSPSDQVAPVINDVGGLSLPEVARSIADLARRAQQQSLPLDRLSHSAFTISDWGQSGLLMSTPMLSSTQSAVLGLYRIQLRPVVVQRRLALRPMMYLALSYDNRLIHGREAAAFLGHVVQRIEDPAALAPGD